MPMQNMISQLRVGGLLVQSAIRNSSWYQVGEKKVRAFPVAEEDFVSFCKQNSLQIIYLLSLDGSDKSVSGYDGMIFLVAQKYSIE